MPHHLSAAVVTEFLLTRLQPGLEAIVLVANLTHDKRASYESFMATQGVSYSAIAEPGLLKSRAADRPSYMPIQYITVAESLGGIYALLLQNMDVESIPWVLLSSISAGSSFLTCQLSSCAVGLERAFSSQQATEFVE